MRNIEGLDEMRSKLADLGSSVNKVKGIVERVQSAQIAGIRNFEGDKERIKQLEQQLDNIAEELRKILG